MNKPIVRLKGVFDTANIQSWCVEQNSGNFLLLLGIICFGRNCLVFKYKISFILSFRLDLNYTNLFFVRNTS